VQKNDGAASPPGTRRTWYHAPAPEGNST